MTKHYRSFRGAVFLVPNKELDAADSLRHPAYSAPATRQMQSTCPRGTLEP